MNTHAILAVKNANGFGTNIRQTSYNIAYNLFLGGKSREPHGVYFQQLMAVTCKQFTTARNRGVEKGAGDRCVAICELKRRQFCPMVVRQ